MKRLSLAALAVAGVLSACAHTRPIDADMGKVESPIRAAEEIGAGQVPQAALHIQYAKDQLAKAQQLEKNGENRRSQMMLLRAQADAELALALTRDSKTQSEVQQLIDASKTN